MVTPAELFRTAAGSDPGRPFLTYYDDASGERIELSYSTFDNWAAKTANMINEDLAARPGELFSLLLPTHWQTAVWYAACWMTGMVAAPGLDPADADHVVCPLDELRAAMACPGQKVAVSMRLHGRPHGDPLPAGVYDYAAEVPAYGDQFAPFHLIQDDDPALVVDDKELSGAEVVATAREAADRWGLGRADRLLAAADLGELDGLLAGLLAPLAVGASVVLCRNLDESQVERRTNSERITKRIPA